MTTEYDPTRNVWSDMLDAWRKAATGATPGQQPWFVAEGQSAQGRFLHEFSRQLSALIQGCGDIDTTQQGWQRQLERRFRDFQAGLSVPPGDWFKPLDDWQSMASSAWATMQQFAPASKWAGMPMPGRELYFSELQRCFSMPGIGPGGATQEHAQAYFRLWAECQRAGGEFQRVCQEANQKGCEIMRAKFLEQMEGDEPIPSLREAYDLWVEAQEEAFQELAFGEEYSRIYGELTNGFIRLRRHVQEGMQPLLQVWGAATQGGLADVVERQQAQRRALRELQQQHKDDMRRVQGLEQELRELKTLCQARSTEKRAGAEQLASGAASGGAAAARTKKKASKKKSKMKRASQGRAGKKKPRNSGSK